ncbi:hypothetical protein LTR62_005781 [Meristemomyces frigidus]|uniref:Methionine aminopeptidase 2 n=1 Tax=Meristemomyces frigidus TaxID=1508187 RepID=A0AAN7TGJ5_9PEZI|nr:hypothetical protein LTR62_005781 [Meristemomyces frigidus]
MGSKSPDEHQRGPDESSANASIADVNPQKPAAASGLLQGALEGQDEDGDDGDEGGSHGSNMNTAGTLEKPKKKKKRTKKKKTACAKQSTPPRVALRDLFPHQDYPEGQLATYAGRDENLKRTTAEEARHVAAVENMDDDFLKDYRKAAEAHRQARHYAQTLMKPGVTLSALAQEIEAGVRSLVGHQGIETGDALIAGLGFPPGFCLNNIAAHWTPNPGAKEVVLQQDDVLKLDFGVHVNGRIVDSAFTVALNPVYDNLLAAVKAATDTGLQEAGIDARIDHISAEIQETMESYEVELQGKVIPVKAVRTITGHNILRYKIHGDKQVPFVRIRTDQRMEEGDIFAIETFGTTGKGYLREEDGPIYGYERNEHANTTHLRSSSAKALLKTIDANFASIVFSKSSLERLGVKQYHLGMKELITNDVIRTHCPLVDTPGSYVAQFEHTILLRPTCKEVISRGDDY